MSALEIPSRVRREWASELEIEAAEARSREAKQENTEEKIAAATETLTGLTWADEPVERTILEAIEHWQKEALGAMEEFLVAVSHAQELRGKAEAARNVLLDNDLDAPLIPERLAIKAQRDPALKALLESFQRIALSAAGGA
jgi:hypothetical protein